VAAVIPTYNRRGGLIRVLEPLFADPHLSEIVVVVDGCRDGSIELLEELASNEERLRPLFIENSGAGEARLAGAAHSSADVVVLLDDDVIAAPGLIAGHRAHHQRAPGLVVCGYLGMRAEPWRPGGSIRELYRELYEKACEFWERDPATVLLGLWAGNLSFRRSDLLRVRDAGPSLVKGYHGDKDLGLRCLELGMTPVFDRSLEATHEYNRSLEGFASDARGSGYTDTLVQLAHLELLGEPEPDRYEGGLPLPALLMMKASRRPRAGAAVSRLLVAMVRAAGLVRWRWLEFNAAKLLRRVETQRGALEAEHRARAARAPA
jgi:glycosyltransferase involved in cell wall biosynthesis